MVTIDASDGSSQRAIAGVDSHHQPNEVLLKKATRNINSIPATPQLKHSEHTNMKRQILLSLAFSVLTANAFAHPVVAEGGSDRLIESRVAEGGSDRLQGNRVAENGSDRLLERRVAEGGADRLQERGLAEGGADRLQERGLAEGGADRLQERGLAEGGADRLQGNNV
jgi:hypothetical protein